jgi:AcrR family transcriptional regulator
MKVASRHRSKGSADRRRVYGPATEAAPVNDARVLAGSAAEEAASGQGASRLRRPALDSESRRKRHQREILNRLVLAARDLLYSRSLEDVRVIDLTEAADVGKGTFFNYFRSKEQLLPPVIVLSMAERLQDALIRARMRQEDAWPMLTNVWRSYLCPADGDWLTYESNVLLAMLANAEVRAQIAERVRKGDSTLDEFIAIAQEQGSLRADLPAGQLRGVLRAFYHGLMIQFWMNDVPPTAAEVDRAFAALQLALAPTRAAPISTKPRKQPTRSVAVTTRRRRRMR